MGAAGDDTRTMAGYARHLIDTHHRTVQPGRRRSSAAAVAGVIFMAAALRAVDSRRQAALTCCAYQAKGLHRPEI